MTGAPLVKLGTDLRSGITTDGRIEREPRGFLVTWIDWDSDFRRNLRTNDLIVGMVHGGAPREAVQRRQARQT